MKKIILFGTILLSAIVMFGFVSSATHSDSQNEIESKVIPLTGAEKSGYSESNRSSL